MKDYPASLRLDEARGAPAGEIDDIIARIGRLLPGATAIRTDRFLGEPLGANNFLRVLVELGERKVPLIVAPNLRFTKESKSAEALGIMVDQLDLLVDDFLALADYNAMGAWCMKASAVPSMAVTPTTLAGEPMAADAYLADMCEELAEAFPKAWSLRFDYQVTGKPGGSQRRRSFLRVFGASNMREIAAIDMSGLPLHARQQILRRDPQPEMLALNLWRMAYWGRQLGCSADELAETIPALMFFTSSLHITQMQLRQ